MALGARVFALGISISLCGLFPPAASAPAGIETVYSVLPSQADPAVAQFNDPSAVIIGKDAAAGAQLAVFLPGTGGRPMNVMPLLRVIAGQGYRVIGLEYDDEPAVVQVCPRDPDLACSADFREERVFGGKDGAAVQNPPQETIVQRLVALLRYLDRQYPSDKWKQYLAGDEPRLEQDRGLWPQPGRRYGGLHRQASRRRAGRAVFKSVGLLRQGASARALASLAIRSPAGALVRGISPSCENRRSHRAGLWRAADSTRSHPGIRPRPA